MNYWDGLFLKFEGITELYFQTWEKTKIVREPVSLIDSLGFSATSDNMQLVPFVMSYVVSILFVIFVFNTFKCIFISRQLLKMSGHETIKQVKKLKQLKTKLQRLRFLIKKHMFSKKQTLIVQNPGSQDSDFFQL